MGTPRGTLKFEQTMLETIALSGVARGSPSGRRTAFSRSFCQPMRISPASHRESRERSGKSSSRFQWKK